MPDTTTNSGASNKVRSRDIHFAALPYSAPVSAGFPTKKCALHGEISCQKSVTRKDDPTLILLIEEGVLAVARGLLIARALA